ncbi:MAG: class I SAM-dependent methyltransferase [Pyrinomonadaceae bacterium]
MGILGGTLGYHLLKWISKDGATGYMDERAYAHQSKLEPLLGKEFWNDIKDRVVIDFGCGSGAGAVEIAQHGARKVIGIDIQEKGLEVARERAAQAGVDDRCVFTTRTDERADVIVAIDSFEHFDDPAAILQTMRGLIKPDGYVIASFGPTWYHPLGGHSFSVFPWAHLIFTEKALIRWRSDFKSDGATRFQEVNGGLNQLTLRRFERLVEHSPFKFASFEAVPIRRLRALANPLTREFTTAIVRCKLVLRPQVSTGG